MSLSLGNQIIEAKHIRFQALSQLQLISFFLELSKCPKPLGFVQVCVGFTETVVDHPSVPALSSPAEPPPDPPPFNEVCINHICGSAKAVVVHVNNRALYLDERRKALNEWSEFLMDLCKSK